MSIYRYTAKDSSGEVLESSIEAATRYEALASLHGRQMTVLALEEVNPAGEAAKGRHLTRTGTRRRFRFTAISLGDRALFCR
ncbi:MAG: hypothetical protein WCL44_12570, partial [bacterium]